MNKTRNETNPASPVQGAASDDRQAMSHDDMQALCAANPAIASGLPLAATSSATEDNKYDCPGDVRFAATSSASGAKGAAEQQIATAVATLMQRMGYSRRMPVDEVAGEVIAMPEWVTIRAALAERSPAVQSSGTAPDEHAAWRQWYFDPNRKGSTFGYQDTREGHHEAFQRKSEAAWMERATRAAPAPEQEAAPEAVSDEDAYAQSGYRHFMSFEKFKAFRAGVIPAAPVEQEAAQVAPPGAQEVVYQSQYSDKHPDTWVDVDKRQYDLYVQHGMGRIPVRTLYTAPVPATTLAEQPEGDSSHVAGSGKGSK